MMDEPDFRGRIEESLGSLYLIITEMNTGKEQVFPIIKVKKGATPCLKYGLWDIALGDLSLGESMEITNEVELQQQIRNIQSQIDSHFSMECMCPEDVDTKYFRGFEVEARLSSIPVFLKVFENRSQSVVKLPLVSFPNATEFLSWVKTLARSAHRPNFTRSEHLDLSDLVHDPHEVLLSLGQMIESWKYSVNLPDGLVKTFEEIEDIIVDAELKY